MPEYIEITNLAAKELDVYARLTENQLAHYYEPEQGVFIAESPKVIERALHAGYQPISLLLDLGQLQAETKRVLAQCGDVPVYTAPDEVLTKLTGFHLTRGMLCAMRRKQLLTVEEICRAADRIAVLEDVVNPTNIGAIFRSAAALGMDAILLTKGCSDPLYRRAARVSMGTVFQIPWTYLEQRKEAVQQEKKEGPSAIGYLKKLGYRTAAMALMENSVNINDEALMAEEKLAVILGTEGSGLSPDTIAECDYTVCIPMAHGVDSLNVAAASAVAFWQLGRAR